MNSHCHVVRWSTIEHALAVVLIPMVPAKVRGIQVRMSWPDIDGQVAITQYSNAWPTQRERINGNACDQPPECPPCINGSDSQAPLPWKAHVSPFIIALWLYADNLHLVEPSKSQAAPPHLRHTWKSRQRVPVRSSLTAYHGSLL